MQYQPGTHIIATLAVTEVSLLNTFETFQQLVNQLVHQHTLQKLGEVYHHFSPAGYTAVICLSESHISVHTWPEYGKVNLDIYLSNFQRNNDGTVQAIYQSFLQFFQAEVLQHQTITR